MVLAVLAYVVVLGSLPGQVPAWVGSSTEPLDPTVEGGVPIASLVGSRQGRLVWRAARQTPRWHLSPEQEPNRFSFAMSYIGKSESHAMRRVGSGLVDEVRDLLFEHLSPALGAKQTLPVLEALLKRTVLVDAAVGLAPSLPEADASNPEYVACLCWRVPIREVVQQFEPATQGRIEWILLRRVVHWQAVDTEPQWATKVPARENYVRRAWAFESTSSRNARLGVVSGVRGNMHACLVQMLEPIAGKASAAKAADAGVARMAPVRRVYCGQYRRNKANGPWLARAFCLMEVPVAPIVAALPKEHRDRAAVILRKR